MTLSPMFLKKHPVTAHDFKFYWDAMMNPFVQEGGAVALRSYFSDVEEIEVIDDLTFVVRWRAIEIDGEPKIKYVAKLLTGQLKPLPSFVFKCFSDGTKILENDQDPNVYKTSSVWANNFNVHWARHVIVSCGPWIFDGMNEDEIRFKRNPDHFFPFDVLVSRQIVSFKNSPDAIWNEFKEGKLDTYSLQPDQLNEYQAFLFSDAYKNQKSSINQLDYVSRSYTYIGWNQKNPFFSNKTVRQALSMAIDRERIIDQNLNGQGMQITGPFFPYSPSYDSNVEPWPYDPELAKRLLEKQGWFDSDADGVIDQVDQGTRNPFRFTITYYVKNPLTKAICEYVREALKEVEIDCRLNGVDISDLSLAFDEKSFDALYLGWALGTPPEDPKQLWDSRGADEKGSSNAVGFSNPEADAIIEKLQYEPDRGERLKLYHQFHRLIHQEAPYTFLYTPKTILLYRNYLQNVFIPAQRQDLIPGANVQEPVSSIFWIKK